MRRWRLPEISSGIAPVNAQCGVSRAYSKPNSGFGRWPATLRPATSIGRAVRAATTAGLACSARASASVRDSVDGVWAATATELATTASENAQFLTLFTGVSCRTLDERMMTRRVHYHVIRVAP